jgi:hypothetical protein
MKTMTFTTPYDKSTADITGWTRRHWEEAMFVLMQGVLNSASPDCARLRIPGPRSHHGQVADELEGFSRSMFMAGPWMSSSEGDTLTFGSESINVSEFYRRGILAGTDPKHPEYWGDIEDTTQHLVEMAALSWGLFLSREKIWDKFSPAEKEQVGGYLHSCNDAKYFQNNWLLFSVITNAVLKRLGMPYSQENLDERLTACDHMYVGEGWYRDGSINRIDYYNSWGFHFYYLLWMIIDGDSRPDLAEMHKQRVREFARDFRYFISGDGSAPCWGRSMIYRFGYLSSIALGQYLDCLDISAGEVKTICNSTMNFYFNQPILTDRNHLSMGWLRPSEWVLENYNCGGSPLWATKAFSLLFLPESDPFWSTPEEPLPIHQGDFSKPLKEAGLVMVGHKESGHVQIVNQKPYHNMPWYNAKYTKFVYSSIFTQDGRKIYGSYNCDNALTFSHDGINFRERWKHENLYTVRDFAVSKYQMYDEVEDWRAEIFQNEFGWITTSILVKDDFMINLHKVSPTIEGMTFREGGFPLGYDQGEPVLSSAEGVEMAAIDGKITYIRNLFGYTEQVKAKNFQEDVSGSNIRYNQSVVPKLGTERDTTEPFVLASMVCGKVGTESLDDLSGKVKSFEQNGDQTTIEFYDGEGAFVQIDEPQDVSITLNGKTFAGPVVMARVSKDGSTWQVLMKDGSEESSD